MLESYEVAAVFRLHDEVSEKLALIAEQVARLNVDLDTINEKLALFGRGNRIVSITNKLRGMNAELAATVDRSAAAAVALDGVAAGGGFVAGRGMGGGGRGRGGEGEKDFHLHGYAPIGPFHARVSAGAGLIGAVGLGYGMYENARMQDAIARILLTSQVPIGPHLTATRQYAALKNIIQSVAMRTGISIRTVEEGALDVTRMMAGFAIGKREQVMKRVLSFGAMEHYLKPSVSMDEASEAMVGLMHMSGKYKPAQLNQLARIMMGISLVTPLNMKSIERAASYAVPVLRAGMGMRPTEVMGLLAMMQRSGIINTKSGTWARSFFEGLVPGTMGSGLFKTGHQKRALQMLGLVDWSGHSTILDHTGHVDLMKAISVMRTHLAAIPQVERIKELEQAFGKRGGQFASMLMTGQFKHQWPKIEKFIHSLASEDQLLSQLYTGSSVQKARVAREELTISLMNLTTAIMGPLSGGLDTLNTTLKAIIGWENKHPTGASVASWGMTGLLGGWLANKLTKGFIGRTLGRGVTGIASGLGIDLSGLMTGVILPLLGSAAAGVGLGWGVDQIPYVGTPFRWAGNELGGGLWDITHPSHAPVTVHTHVKLDGHEIAHAVSRHASSNSGVIHGYSGINSEETLLPGNLHGAH